MANTQPVFTATPQSAMAQISTANTNLDGTGAIVTVLTAGAYGTRIFRIYIKAAGATTSGMVRLYIHDGANCRLWREYQVTAITPTASTPTWETEVVFYDFSIPTGYSLRASTHNAEAFNVIAIAGDF